MRLCAGCGQPMGIKSDQRKVFGWRVQPCRAQNSRTCQARGFPPLHSQHDPVSQWTNDRRTPFHYSPPVIFNPSRRHFPRRVSSLIRTSSMPCPVESTSFFFLSLMFKLLLLQHTVVPVRAQNQAQIQAPDCLPDAMVDWNWVRPPSSVAGPR